jgi:hypothetical protein
LPSMIIRVNGKARTKRCKAQSVSFSSCSKPVGSQIG